MGLQGLLAEFIIQANYAVSIILIITILGTLYKRAWVVGFTSILAISFFLIFINKPTILKDLSGWLGGMFGL